MASAFDSCPPHYVGDGQVSCSRAMKSMCKPWWDAHVPPMAVYWGQCALKYLWRWPLKKQKVKDIDKAIDCLQKLREEITGKGEGDAERKEG